MSERIRLLKFDSVFPYSYLEQLKERHAGVIRRMSYAEYYGWLMAQRVGGSDFLTHYMNEAGWEAREFLAQDATMLQKLLESGELPRAGGLAGSIRGFFEGLLSVPLGDLLRAKAARKLARQRREWLIRRYIDAFRPDVIFIREPSHLDGKFFDRYRGKLTIVSLIGCNTNHAINWDPHRSDIIFTLTKEYLDFFRAQGIEAHLFEYGVDERVAKEVEGLPKQYGCTFVGFLGQPWQSRKTELMNQVAEAVDFKWWGLKGSDIARFPALERTYQGETAGMEMFRIYKQSKIVLNDYVDTAAGQNVNIRTKEVLGVGSCLLTREAANIRDLESEGALVTFKDTRACIEKANRLLADDMQREKIAARGLQTAFDRFDYQQAASRVMTIVADAHRRKRSGVHRPIAQV
jgi:hypothetical protein